MFYILILLIVIFDQLIKVVIQSNFVPGQSIPVINNIFHLTYVRNIGAGFGILAGRRSFFIILTVLILIFLMIYRYKMSSNIYSDIAIALIIGGAIGNLIDRVRLRYVVDYLDFRIWPVFNLADSAVSVGAVILMIYIWNQKEDGQGDNTNV
ncbi:MAG: signal peptidase II [Halanaerobiaceae bacterium]